MNLEPENRRSFVKKSLATSMTLTFAGLIRAHGDGGVSTTADPFGYTTTDSTLPETTAPWATTGGTSTTIDPFGYTTTDTPIPETTAPWATTATTEFTFESTIPSKPKRRLYTLVLYVKGIDPQTGDPIFTDQLSQAKAFNNAFVPPPPPVAGSPAGNGDSGTLTAGGIAFGSGMGTDIQTNENHTSIDKNNDVNPNPKSQYSTIPAAGGGDIIRCIVQTSYTWVYPSSP